MSLLASAGALCFLIVIQLCYSLPCGKSGYCSVGKLEPFVGSITAGMHAQQQSLHNTARILAFEFGCLCFLVLLLALPAADAFRAAADARSYKNELIVMVVTSHRQVDVVN